MAKTPEGRKISKLMDEGKDQRQAVAMALNMKERGRLGPRGGYKRVGGDRGGKR